MPTGYTANVEDGTMTELRDYALLCARGIGFTLPIRDEPFETPLPEAFKKL